MANLFADLSSSIMAFEEMEDPILETADQDHPHLVLFADPFLCSSSDPSSLYNLELGESELLFQKDRTIQDDKEDSTTLLSDTFHEQGLQKDSLHSTTDSVDGNYASDKKESRKRKHKNGEGVPARYRPTSRNAARERSRVKSLRLAFLELQNSLPSVPPNTKLSKLDVLVLATTYIAHLMKILNEGGGTMDLQQKGILQETDGVHDAMTPTGHVISVTTLHDAMNESVSQCASNMVSAEEHHHRLQEKGYLHPVRKWPMRSRLYAGVFEEHVRYVSSTGSSIQTLALPDINYSMPLLDANLNVLFSFPN